MHVLGEDLASRVLRITEDDQILHTFIKSHASANLAITPLIWDLRIECNFGVQPWAHFALVSEMWLVDVDEIHLSVSCSSDESLHLYNTSTAPLPARRCFVFHVSRRHTFTIFPSPTSPVSAGSSAPSIVTAQHPRRQALRLYHVRMNGYPCAMIFYSRRETCAHFRASLNAA